MPVTFSPIPDPKRQHIQGLRAIAALAVVLFHGSSLLPGGFLGVDVFFVISGYIIADIAKNEIRSTGHFSFANFFSRRLRRVLPPMVVVVAATLVMGLLIDTPTRMIESLPLSSLAALTALINFYFLSNATDYFQTFHSHPILHLWSVAIELHFYILFAAALKFGMLFRDRLSSRTEAGAVAILVGTLTVISLVAALTIVDWHSLASIELPSVFSFFTLPTRLWEFGFGILANLVERRVRSRLANPLVVHGLQSAGAVLLLMGLAYGSKTWLVPGYQAIAPCFASAVLLATGDRGIVGSALSWRGLTYLGDRSYSIYLWQGPLVVYAAILFATPLSIALAAIASIVVSIVTYDAVENTFRKPFSRYQTPRPMRVRYFAMYACSVLACVVVYFLVPTTFRGFAAPAPLRATNLDSKCQRQRGTPGLAPCVYHETSQRKVLLIGDSHAGAVSQAVVDAAASAGWQVHVATASACAVPEYPENISYRSSCTGYATNVLTYAREQRVDLVILQQFSEFYVVDLRIGLSRWKEGLSRFISLFGEADIPVLVIGDSLPLPLAVGRPIWAKSWHVDLSSAVARRRSLEEAELSIAHGRAGSKYILSREYLCVDAKCPVFDSGAWHYTDTDHLSYKGAERLAVPIAYEMRRTAGQSPSGRRD